MYPRINKHDPERDIGRMHRRQEVLQYLASTHSHTATPPVQGRPETEECFTMSESLGDHVNLASFVAVPLGTTPDPAKRVCGPNIPRPTQTPRPPPRTL